MARQYRRRTIEREIELEDKTKVIETIEETRPAVIRPTPTPDEMDRARLGEDIPIKAHDGSPPQFLTRRLRPAEGGGTYQTRDMQEDVTVDDDAPEPAPTPSPAQPPAPEPAPAWEPPPEDKEPSDSD